MVFMFPFAFFTAQRRLTAFMDVVRVRVGGGVRVRVRVRNFGLGNLGLAVSLNRLYGCSQSR